jgi:hypothetical protein
MTDHRVRRRQGPDDIACPGCGKLVGALSIECPHCRRNDPSGYYRAWSRLRVVQATVLALVLVGAILMSLISCFGKLG